MNYALLHVHSVFSVKDSIATPKEYIKKIEQINANSEHKITSMALTEHGNMFSVVHLASATKNSEVKPIYGVEMYHVMTDEQLGTYKSKSTSHLVLLAKNDIGYKNIMKISTHGAQHASSHRFITSLESMKGLGEGVICLTACFGGHTAQSLFKGEDDVAESFVNELKDIFEEVYLEIQPHKGFPSQLVVNEKMKELSKKTNIPIVLTTDTHYVEKEDGEYRDLLMFTKKEEDEEDGDSEYCNLHVHTVEELIEFCDEFGFSHDVLSITDEIAKRCSVTIGTDDPMALMPHYECPDSHTEASYLRKLSTEGLKFRLELAPELTYPVSDYIVRLEYELDVIVKMGFSGYFLILWDWFNWCRKEKILLGPGRGSAAGSLVAYVLDITKVDPIENGLIFERFLNVERIELPD